MQIIVTMSPEGAGSAAMKSQAMTARAGGMSLRDRLAVIRDGAEGRRSAQRFKIRRYLREHGPTSDFVITRDTGITAHTVLVRLHELESVGDVICERTPWPDDPTRFRHLWRLDR